MFPPSPYQVQDTPQATPLVKVGEEDMKDVSEMSEVFQVHGLSACPIDSFNARVRSPRYHKSSPGSRVPQPVWATSLFYLR